MAHENNRHCHQGIGWLGFLRAGGLIVAQSKLNVWSGSTRMGLQRLQTILGGISTMPNYEYQFQRSQHDFEVLIWSQRDENAICCPKCQCRDLQRILSPFSASCGSGDSPQPLQLCPRPGQIQLSLRLPGRLPEMANTSAVQCITQ